LASRACASPKSRGVLGKLSPAQFGVVQCPASYSPVFCHQTKRSRPHADKIEFLKRYYGKAVYSRENKNIEKRHQNGNG